APVECVCDMGPTAPNLRTILGDAARLYEERVNQKPASVPPFERADRRKPRALAWLWKDKVSLGTITLFIGDPEQGKSLIMRDMAARITPAKAGPDGAPPFGPRDVVMLAAEDPTDQVLLPRLQAAGADLARIHVLPMEETFLLDDKKYMERLRWLVIKHEPAL